MLRPTNSPDPARLVTVLGIPIQPSTGTERLLADIEATKQRRIVLGLWTEPPAPTTEAERAERMRTARNALAALIAEARAERIARGDLWEREL